MPAGGFKALSLAVHLEIGFPMWEVAALREGVAVAFLNLDEPFLEWTNRRTAKPRNSLEQLIVGEQCLERPTLELFQK
jgi:hypothetical protein